MSEDAYTRLVEMVGTLRRNREAVPLEVLKTKYGAAYRALKEGIYRGALSAVVLDAFDGLSFLKKEDFEDTVVKAGNALNNDAAFVGAVKSALFKEFNVDLFRAMTCEAPVRLYYDIYMPYAAQTLQPVPGGMYSRIFGATWKAAEHRWVTNDGFVIGICPPEPAAMAQWRDAYIRAVSSGREQRIQDARSLLRATG